MQLTDLRPNEGARKRNKRVGRGRASGHGKTSTRGHNGQGQRSGESKRFGFEGGQTPLFRRLPKIHNFNDVPERDWVELNVGALNNLKANAEVTPDSLVECKLLRKHNNSLRILGNGDLKVPLKVTAHHVTAGAKAKIEAAGGSVELIVAKEIPGKRAKRARQAVERAVEREAKRLAPKPIKQKKVGEPKKKADKAPQPQGGGGGVKKTDAKGGKGKPGDKSKQKGKK